MDKKKIAIGIIALVVIIVATFVVIGITSNSDVEITYDDYYSITVPGDFVLNKTNGNVDHSYPANKSYTVALYDLKDNPKTFNSTFNILKENKKIFNIKNMSSYKIGNITVYDVMMVQSNTNKQWFENTKTDAKYSRFIYYIIPGAKKVYSLVVFSNSSSTNLYSPEIKEIVKSVNS